jgi:hypothetical protein
VASCAFDDLVDSHAILAGSELVTRPPLGIGVGLPEARGSRTSDEARSRQPWNARNDGLKSKPMSERVHSAAGSSRAWEASASSCCAIVPPEQRRVREALGDGRSATRQRAGMAHSVAVRACHPRCSETTDRNQASFSGSPERGMVEARLCDCLPRPGARGGFHGEAKHPAHRVEAGGNSTEATLPRASPSRLPF